MSGWDILRRVGLVFESMGDKIFNHMNADNKTVLEKANAAISAGDHEGFLACCTDDTEWNFIGDRVLRGKEAVRQYMLDAYAEPPKFRVDELIGEGEFVTAVGRISLKEDGQWNDYDYCDVWQLRDGKLDRLRAFVVADRG